MANDSVYFRNLHDLVVSPTPAKYLHARYNTFTRTYKQAMAAVLRLPTEDFLSEKYMDTFYRAHVASRTRGDLDEDIAAIEAEIRK